ncbi:MAG: hypothetical protein VYD81_05795 [Planctomycetota bacterium]|nr:hypothetical protein [Planctomycetota bacterium]
MNSKCRLKSERPDKAAFISFFAGLLAAVSLCGPVCTRSLAQEEIELRPVDREDRARQAARKKEGAEVAAKVSPEVAQLIRKMISVRGSDQKEAETKLLRMGLRVVPELRAWVRQVSGNTEKVEIVLRKIFRKVSGDKDSGALVSRESSAGQFLEQRLYEAMEHLRYGRYQLARKIAESILVLDRDSPLRFLCRRLIRQARERKLKKELVTRVDSGALVYEVGEKPQIFFRVLNKSGSTARFDIQQGIVGELFIGFDRCHLDGSHIANGERVPLRIKNIQQKVVLKPEEGWECAIDYKLPDNLPLRQVACRARFRVVFRPSRWEIDGNKDSNIPLTSEETEFWVLPPGKKRKFEDPLKRLKLALLLKQNEDVFIAGWFCVWAGKKDDELNNRFKGLLLDNLLEVAPGLKPLFYELLRQSTGVSYKTDAEWVKWWKAQGAKKSGS